MPTNLAERHSVIRGKLYKFLNLGLCMAGMIFVIIGVFKSTLLLYIGCALIGAAIGGFIRSRLPINAMVPSTGVHLVYRSDGRRNMQTYNGSLQTYVIMHSQQPSGIGQKKINQCTSITKYFSNNVFSSGDSFDRISIISAITEKAESNENCCIVCLIQFKSGQEVRQLSCQHMFHINCIDKWLKINRLCPTCRCDVTLPTKAKQTTNSNVDSTCDLNEEGCERRISVFGNGNEENAQDTNNTRVVVNPDAIVDPSEAPNLREDQVGTNNDVIEELAREVVIEVADDITGS